MRTIDMLRPRQRAAVKFMDTHDGTMLLADMGTGKTAITLTHIIRNPAPTLVISTLRVAKLVWERESKLWEHTHDLWIEAAVGTAEERDLALMWTDADMHTINIENVQWLLENFDLRRWDRIVFDELSLWKGGKKRWKAIHKNVRHAQRIGLTGTPATNGLLGLWPMAELIDHTLLPSSRPKFKRKYFYPTDYKQYRWAPFPGTEETIYDMIAPIVFRIENDKKDMPELVLNEVPVELPQSAYDLMGEMSRKFVATLKGKKLTAASAGVLTGKLQQIANGRIYEDNSKDFVEVHNAKVEACVELVEELNGQPCVIAYTYQHDLAALREALPDAVVVGEMDDNELLDKWNAGELPVIIGHPGAFGHGLNMQEGGHHLIWFGLNWDLDYFDQTIARLWRSGQRAASVFVHILSAVRTVDGVIFNALQGKKSVQDAMLDYYERVLL